MNDFLSPLSLAAAGLYGVVIVSAGAAATSATKAGQPIWHRRSWLILAGLFGAFALARLLNLEELLRDYLRSDLRANAGFAHRREFQRPLVAALLLVVAIIGFWWIGTIRKIKGRRNIVTILALTAGGLMLVLIALRLISFHPIDAVLYGALKLNWVGDIGLSLVVAVSAFGYVKILRSSR